MSRRKVVVVGAGNAALCAALAAEERGASVTVLEAAPRNERGGNSHFTAGLVRFPHRGVRDVAAFVDESLDLERIEIPPYPAQAFRADLERTSDGRILPDLADVLVREARPAMDWLRGRGVPFRLSTGRGRQAFQVEGKLRFWGGACVEFGGGGNGHMERMFELVDSHGVETHYERPVRGLRVRDGRVVGVHVAVGAESEEIAADAVVLACGGFEAERTLREEHLGAEWSDVQVRGTAHNRGAGLRMAFEVGAAAVGDWAGCHAVAWDANAPDTGDWRIRNAFQKHSYPFGIVVNADADRFVDEGADFRNYTYARYGAEILAQPGRIAYQVFDAKVAHLFRREYSIPEATRVEADSLEELAHRLGLPPLAFIDTVQRFNDSVNDAPFDPTRLDGKSADVTPPKSNWAQRLDTPPYLGFPIRCAITFTFGGVAVDGEARVLREDGTAVPGLFAAGEMVGGLFWGNYPGGAGLTSGSVFGRLAGAGAGVGAANASG